MTFLAVHGIRKHYQGTPALDGIEFGIPIGCRMAIVGPSGSGKTTLLRIIAGFEAPDEGRVTLAGDVITDGPAAVPAHLRSIGFVPQDGALFPHLSVAENVGFGLPRSTPQRADRIRSLLDAVELDRSMLERRPHELSGGQQQRVALARALARHPKLMLLDEPFSALDAGLRESLRKSVAHVLEEAGVTTILVTHDQAEALSFADQVAVLRQGRLAQVGSPRELYQRPTDSTTATFLGDALVMPAQLGDGWALCAFGRIAADTAGRRGTAEIMLRPEQISMTPISPFIGLGDLDQTACHAQVTAIDFGGAVCTVSLSLLSGDGWFSGAETGPARMKPALAIRTSSAALPRLGSRVKVAVIGMAHVLN